VLAGVLLKRHEAAENADEIAAMSGLGFVVPGFGDLSVSLDRPLRYDHPDVVGAIERIETACLDAGVPMLGVHGAHFNDPDATLEAIDDGYARSDSGTTLAPSGRFSGIASTSIETRSNNPYGAP